jgi:hypothetical protein
VRGPRPARTSFPWLRLEEVEGRCSSAGDTSASLREMLAGAPPAAGLGLRRGCLGQSLLRVEGSGPGASPQVSRSRQAWNFGWQRPSFCVSSTEAEPQPLLRRPEAE